MADSSLCTKTFNESNYENNKTTKTAENLENTKTRTIMDYEMEENIKPQKHEENTKQQTHEETEENDIWKFIGRRNEKLEFAYFISRIDDKSMELMVNEHGNGVSEERFTTLKCVGKLNGQSLELMLDTGATASLIRTSLIKKLPNSHSLALRNCDGSSIRVANGEKIYPRGIIELMVDIAGLSIPHEFMVFDEVPFNAILGMDYIYKAKWIVDIPQGKLVSERAEVNTDLIMFTTSTVIPSHYIYLSEDVVIEPRVEMVCRGATGCYGNGNECYLIDGMAEQEESYGINVAHGYGNLSDGRMNLLIANFGTEKVYLTAGTVVAVANKIDEYGFDILAFEKDDLMRSTVEVDERSLCMPTQGVDEKFLKIPTVEVDDMILCDPTKRVVDNDIPAKSAVESFMPAKSADEESIPAKRAEENEVSAKDAEKSIIPAKRADEYGMPAEECSAKRLYK